MLFQPEVLRQETPRVDIKTITNPSFPDEVQTLTAQFIKLKTELAQNPRANIAIATGDGSTTRLRRFGKQLADDILTLHKTLRHINPTAASAILHAPPTTISEDEAINFLSLTDLPEFINELVAAFCKAKDSVADGRIRTSQEMEDGGKAYFNLQTDNTMLQRALESLKTSIERLVRISGTMIADLSLQTAQAARSIRPVE